MQIDICESQKVVQVPQASLVWVGFPKPLSKLLRLINLLLLYKKKRHLKRVVYKLILCNTDT